ncbi:MAG: glycine cleavage system aminomethyltransferase GcvT [Proteobacteria bacterium]|nr:glycine cleavage system aminomethyltransferase GcvT [Pseudomonadota bacterium]
MASQSPLKRTPLNEEHRRLGARMVDFGGWDMPVQYSGVIDEHKTVRTAVGLFDVSHMGELMVSGRGANDFLQKMTTNDVTKIAAGQAQYSALCKEDGCVIDDIIVYRRGMDSFLVCVNASNTTKDEQWLRAHLPSSGVILENESEAYAQIAVQGPKARELVQQIVDINISQLKYYWFAEGKVLGQPSIIARTGYTGELGYELYVPSQGAARIWAALVEAGQKFGGKPCGLGARDTLRLEMGYLLYGNDMDESINALECGLGWVTKFSKGEFIGSKALAAQKEAGLKRQIVGLQMVDKAIARHGYKVFSAAEGGQELGWVTSGTVGPSINLNVGMAYVTPDYSAAGSEIFVEIRGERKAAKVVRKPFYANGTAQL